MYQGKYFVDTPLEKYQWIEKIIHLVVHIYPICSSIYLLYMKAFNSIGSQYCWIASTPWGCGDSASGIDNNDNNSDIDVGGDYNGSSTVGECTRGPQNIKQILIYFYVLPLSFFLLFPTIMMSILCFVVWRKQQKRSRLLRVEENTNSKRTKIVNRKKNGNKNCNRPTSTATIATTKTTSCCNNNNGTNNNTSNNNDNRNYVVINGITTKIKPPVVGMKMDIEGSEYIVLPDLILTGSICHFDFVFGEFHSGFAPIQPSPGHRVPLNTLKELQEYEWAITKIIESSRNCNVRWLTIDDESYLHDGQPLPTTSTSTGTGGSSNNTRLQSQSPITSAAST